MDKTKIAHRAVNILGFQLLSSSQDRLLEKLKIHLSQKNDPLIIFTPNAEQLVQAQSNPNFCRYLKQSDLLLPDGISLASKVLAIFNKTQPLAARIAGVDLAFELINLSQEKAHSVLVVGGRNYQEFAKDSQVTTKADQNCWQLADNLFWTPAYEHYSTRTKPEEESLINCITSLQPQIILVALGAPHQEEWILEHRQLLKNSGCLIALTVGGAIDMILGKLTRAPLWMRRFGLEWLYRLIQEPWRWKRQTRLIKFAWLVMRQVFTGYQLP